MEYIVYACSAVVVIGFITYKYTRRSKKSYQYDKGDPVDDTVAKDTIESCNEKPLEGESSKTKARKRNRKGVNFAHVNQQLADVLVNSNGKLNNKAWFAFYKDHVERIPHEAVVIGASILGEAAKSNTPLKD